MADRGYTFELVEGIALFLAAQQLDGVALATYKPGGGYDAADPRPVYWRTGSEAFDEIWQINALMPVAGPANGVVTPVQIMYRGARNAPDRYASRIVDALTDAFHPGGFPRVHTTFGRVPIGFVGRPTGGQLPDDGNKRVRYSLTYQFRGKRVVV